MLGRVLKRRIEGVIEYIDFNLKITYIEYLIRFLQFYLHRKRYNQDDCSQILPKRGNLIDYKQ